MRTLLFLFMGLAGAPALRAQPDGIDQESDLHVDPAGDKFLRWYGHENRNYFLLVSDPLDHLRKWTWAPVIEAGHDELISYEVDGTADKGFFRLKYTSIQPKAGETLETADFDADGISNIDEIDPPGPFGQTDPLAPDTDGDGLPDGWEVANGLDPRDDGSIDSDNGGGGDQDGDGVTNKDEEKAGTPANDASKFPPFGVMIARTASGNSTSLEPLPGGSYSSDAEWDDENEPEEYTSGEVTPDFLQGLYSENGLVFPDELTESMNTSVMGVESFSCSSEVLHTSSSDGSGFSSSSRNARIWLKVPVQPGVRKFHYVRVKREVTVNVPFAIKEKLVSMEPVEFVVPANSTYSLPLDIKPVPTAVANKTVILSESLIRLDIKDDGFATGVDNVSVGAVESPDNGRQDAFWIMAPTGGGTDENDTVFGFYPQMETIMTMTCSNATPDPSSVGLDLDEKTISWTGTGTSTTENTPTFKFQTQVPEPGASPDMLTVDLPIRVKTMKKCTINVAVWLVPSLQSGGVVRQPAVKPTKEDLEEYLNWVYLPQINAGFNCTVVETTPVSFDNGDGSVVGAPVSAISPGNGYLDLNKQTMGEAQAVISTNYDPAANINIYIIGGIAGVKPRVWLPDENKFLFDGGYAAGYTNSQQRICLLPSMPVLGESPMEQKDTISHEIGHVILGDGHPDEYSGNAGKAPLLGVDPTNRLMCSGTTRKKSGNSRLLVKKEWDEAEIWFAEERAANRMQ